MTALRADSLTVSFGDLVAIDGVSLSIDAGDAVGLVGESGSGKTTVARVLCGLQTPDAGRVLLNDHPLPRRRSVAQRRAVQMVFQDPFASLNPRRRIGSMLIELLRAHHLSPGVEHDRARELIELVGLPDAALDRYPAAFSGGQRQRIAIARALATQPRILIADEPVSALDVSIQATVLQVFGQLRSELGIGLLLISHNLAVVRVLCETVAVMYLGRIVETAPTAELFHDPRHPYTQALLAAVPRLRPRSAALDSHRDTAIAAPVPSHHDPTAGSSPVRTDSDAHGCPYAAVCPRAEQICRARTPELATVGAGPRRAACHFRDEPSRRR
jgi:oligopeptide/dipeptide ABC transporter ATP-binding protein